MKKLTFTIAWLILVVSLQAQFAAAAGYPGTTAISKEDDRFIGWATGCTVNRGWLDISDTTIGRASAGAEQAAIGEAGQNGVLCLGDGGEATLTFSGHIVNGPGFDFAVFENGFPTGDSSLVFLEFAFVEVSSDGKNFVRFPAVTHIQDTAQLAMVGMEAALVNNLAGKYANGYGTPFDLEELKDSAGLDVNHISHIRIVDVVGSVNSLYATYDSEGNKVNDPWPTAFPTGGFDLDAVGVMHIQGLNGIGDVNIDNVSVFPNPVTDNKVFVSVPEELLNSSIRIVDITGRVIYTSIISSAHFRIETALSKGTYLLFIESGNDIQALKFMVE